MSKRTYITQKGPKAMGPYSTAVIHGNTLYVSGMGPINPEDNKLVKDSVEAEAHQAFKNVGIILDELGCTYGDVLKTTLYLANMDDFTKVNKIYEAYFGPDFPARTTIQAGRLPLDIKVEIDVIAEYKGK